MARTPAQNLKRIWEEKAHELKFTQRQAAEKLDWSQGAISQYISGITELSVPAIIKLANFLGVPPEEIDPNIDLNKLPKLGAWEVLSNTSGKPVRIKKKLFNLTHKHPKGAKRKAINTSCFIADQPISLLDQETNAVLPPGVTILTVPIEASKAVDLSADKNYPPLIPPLWLIKYRSNKRPPFIIRQSDVPTIKSADIFRVTGLSFI